jgi:hypothetical protein
LTDAPQASIHHRRRWFYALWCALLLASAAAFALWRIPARVERPLFGVIVSPERLPDQVAVGLWTGPRSGWNGGVDFTPLQRDEKGRFVHGAAPIPIALRRWVPRTLIPGHSHDLAVLRFTDPAQGTRWFFVSLREDWYNGSLRDGKRFYLSVSPGFGGLRTEATLPDDLR